MKNLIKAFCLSLILTGPALTQSVSQTDSSPQEAFGKAFKHILVSSAYQFRDILTQDTFKMEPRDSETYTGITVSFPGALRAGHRIEAVDDYYDKHEIKILFARETDRARALAVFNRLKPMVVQCSKKTDIPWSVRETDETAPGGSGRHLVYKLTAEDDPDPDVSLVYTDSGAGEARVYLLFDRYVHILE